MLVCSRNRRETNVEGGVGVGGSETCRRPVDQPLISYLSHLGATQKLRRRPRTLQEASSHGAFQIRQTACVLRSMI